LGRERKKPHRLERRGRLAANKEVLAPLAIMPPGVAKVNTPRSPSRRALGRVGAYEPVVGYCGDDALDVAPGQI